MSGISAPTPPPPPKLGAWEVKSTTPDTVYQAASDGFVVGGMENGSYYIIGKTDDATPPMTKRATCGAGAYSHGGITMPVRKDDYWQISSDASSLTFVYWIPLE